MLETVSLDPQGLSCGLCFRLYYLEYTTIYGKNSRFLVMPPVAKCSTYISLADILV
ncbi:hypothetical protein Mapa_003386 [Marchantia paleacea]|nr:hypothetical protein Mapa_003386 [Marchantia paleacea]